MLVGMLVIIGAYLPILTLGGVEGRMFRPLAQSVILLLLQFAAAHAHAGSGLVRPGAGHRVARCKEPQFLNVLRSAYEQAVPGLPPFSVVVSGPGLAAGGRSRFVFPRGWARISCLTWTKAGWSWKCSALRKSAWRNPWTWNSKPNAPSGRRCRKSKTFIPASACRRLPPIRRARIKMTFTSASGRARSGAKSTGTGSSKSELAQIIKTTIERSVPDQELELNQPIAVRFDELLEGVRTDLAIKLFGPDYDQLDSLAGKVAGIVKKIPDAGEVVIDQPGRTAMREFIPDPIPAVRFMIAGDVMNNAVSIGLAGREVGRVDEGDIFYPIVVRVAESARTNPATLDALPVRSADSSYVATLSDVGKWVDKESSVSTITREQAERREAIMVTVDSPDVVGFVARARAAIQKQIKLPPGCRLEFSGAYKNWQSGSRRLLVSSVAFHSS